MSTLAERKAATAARRSAREKMIRRVIEMDDRGCKQAEIGAAINRSNTAVSVILKAAGRAKRQRGVRRVGRAKTALRVCVDCGKTESIRADHKHTLRCLSCAQILTGLKLGSEPHNKGVRYRIPRICETCGYVFEVLPSILTKKPYRYGRFCSKDCYGVAMQTPGSRYSEIGMNRRRRR